jgi:hypothetical protein
MGFLERKRDRRQRYSLRGHISRIRQTKGLRHIVQTTLATALILGVAFARCSSDSITGPSTGGSQAGTREPGSGTHHGGDDGDDGIDPGLLITPLDIGPPSAIETAFGPINLPVDMQATACNGDVVQWDPKRTYVTMSGFMAINPATGVVYIRGHFKERAQGVGTIVVPTRKYTGYEEYDKEYYLRPPTSVDEEEFELKIIAKGNIEPWPLYPNDDFHMYVRVRTVTYLGVVRIESVKAYMKCW